jgi:hypothetical protein|tara:strand:+ start:347 stop:682 length:336 start_codon:yes stop_codon:yes gene_type:complete
MTTEQESFVCTECNKPTENRQTTVEFRGQEIFLFDPIICADCLLELCEKYAVPCANCGEAIPPFSQVGVLKGNCGEKLFVHMTTACNSFGSAFHGYLGKGEIRNFIQIEAC